MAHFAKIDENNIVTEVLAVANEDLLDGNGVESEATGVAFLEALLGDPSPSVWKQTSYNGTFRGTYASNGGTYDADLDKFIPEAPYDSWIFSTEENVWEAPVVKPVVELDEFEVPVADVSWNEDTVSWEVTPQAKAHYGRFDDTNTLDKVVTVFAMHIFSDGEEDDSLGIALAIETEGPGDWRRIYTPPTGS